MPFPSPTQPTPAQRISPEQGAILWCMRVWVAGLHQSIGAEDRIQGMLDRLGASEAAPPLLDFMAALRAGAARTIAVDCVCQANISDDEQALLDTVALAQESRLFEALLLLRSFLHREAAPLALDSAEDIGRALARVGCFLPVPEAGVQQFAFSVLH